MRSNTPPDLGGRCARCFLPPPLCLCPDAPRLAVRTRLLVVRHHKEALKTTNTARLACLALEGSRMAGYGTPNVPFDPAPLTEPGTWLLFPDGGTPAGGRPPPRQLVVLDGTWAQARRMVQRVPELRGLPRLALPPPPPRTRLRTPPHPDGMSTLEAIAQAYRVLEGEHVAAPLEALHDLFVERVLTLRGRLG